MLEDAIHERSAARRDREHARCTPHPRIGDDIVSMRPGKSRCRGIKIGQLLPRSVTTLECFDKGRHATDSVPTKSQQRCQSPGAYTPDLCRRTVPVSCPQAAFRERATIALGTPSFVPLEIGACCRRQAAGTNCRYVRGSPQGPTALLSLAMMSRQTPVSALIPVASSDVPKSS